MYFTLGSLPISELIGFGDTAYRGIGTLFQSPAQNTPPAVGKHFTRRKPKQITMKIKTLAILLLFLNGININGQELKQLEPTIGLTFDFTPESIKKFNSEESFEKCRVVWDKISSEKRTSKEFTAEEKNILKYCDETKDEIWDVVSGACSWYCGGGPKKITSSSFLKSQGDNTYEPKNAHDLNYKTAWVEGVAGYGIGEYLEYHFAPESPRITEIIVVNGYVKSRASWENNSRVKQLKLYINDKPHAILNLMDVYAEQSFILEPIGNSNRKDLALLKKLPDWTLKFEIIDVYKGNKYDDVAITEIYFSGLDVHCFIKGTKITLPNKSTMNIEDLKVGDKVLTYDYSKNQLIEATIEKLEKVIHSGLVTYIFENGLEITGTADHPFKINGKGWSSLSPKKSEQYKGIENIQKIEIGDLFEIIEETNELKTNRLVSIKYQEEPQETYTISKLDFGDNFIANGFIVAVEDLK